MRVFRLYLFGLLIPFFSYSQITSDSNGSWTDCSNWAGNVCPTATDDVVIRHSVTLTSSLTVRSLSVSNTGSGAATLEIKNGATLTIASNCEIIAINKGSATWIRVNGSTLIVQGSLMIERTSDNSKSAQCKLQVTQNSGTPGTVNISNNLSVHYRNGAGSEGNTELDLNDNTAVTVGGDLNMTTYAGGNKCTLHQVGSSILTITGDATFTHGGAKIMEFDLDGSSRFTANNIIFSKTGGTDDFRIYPTTTSNLKANGHLSIIHNGATVGLVHLQTSSDVEVAGNLNLSATAANQILIEHTDGTSNLIIGGTITRANGFGTYDYNNNKNAILELSGSALQTLPETAGGGTDGFFYGSLKINNTSGLLPTVTLENRLSGGVIIEGDLLLENGQLDLNNEKIYLTNTNGDAIVRNNGSVLCKATDYSEAIVWLVNTNGDTRIFPFSDEAGNYLPIQFTRTASNIGNVTISTYATNASTNPNNAPAPSGVTISNTLKHVDRYWSISLENPGTADVTFTYTDTDIGGQNNISESDLEAIRWNGAAWDAGTGTANAGTNTVTITDINQFSTWSLKDPTALPVELSFFKAKLEKNNVVLKWITQSEKSNALFEIEKSDNGIDWEVIGQVAGALNSIEVKTYYFLDRRPYYFNNYYRLKQIDIDASFEYSPIEVIYFDNKNQDVSVFPNPASDVLKVRFPKPGRNRKIELFDLSGKQQYFIEESNGDTITLNLQNIEKGLYLLRITQNEEVWIRKVYIRKPD